MFFRCVYPFSNVSITVTFDICTNAFYKGDLPRHTFPLKTFDEFIEIATNGVECSFNEVMYKQIDGVAMGFLLVQFLQISLLGFTKPSSFVTQINHRYVVDTFKAFNGKKSVMIFFIFLYLLSSLRSTFEKECNGSFPFLEALVEKSEAEFIT